MLWLWGILLALWAFDHTYFYYCLTTNFVTDWVDHKWNDFIYDLHVIDNYADRNRFFNALMNEELYEICYPVENLIIDEPTISDIIENIVNEKTFVNPFNSSEIGELKEIFKLFREDDEIDIWNMINKNQNK